MRQVLTGCAIALALCATVAQAEMPEEMLVRAGYPQINDPAPEPFGNYVNGNIAGKLLLVSSAAPQDVNGEFGPKDAWLKGRFGEDLEGDTKGAKYAELACLRSLRFAKAVIGDLSKIKRVLRVTVASLTTPDFKDHTKVADGCSNLLTQVFGPERGAHARVNVGVDSMPFGVALEISIEYELE